MNIPIPDFISLPSSELLTTISVVLMIVGICLVCGGVLLRFLLYKKGKKVTGAWICIVGGALLIVDHGIQLFF